MKNLEKFHKKFNVTKLVIFESKFWTWSLRPNQSTLGSSLLSLNRECLSFSDLSEEEFQDLKYIVYKIEKTLLSAFHFDKINYLMLMMVDNQLHYHVIPRYKNNIVFDGYNWDDKGWPGLPILNNKEITFEEGKQIIKEIRKHMNKVEK